MDTHNICIPIYELHVKYLYRHGGYKRCKNDTSGLSALSFDVKILFYVIIENYSPCSRAEPSGAVVTV